MAFPLCVHVEREMLAWEILWDMAGYSLCVCMCVRVLVAQSCLTLCDPIDCSPPGSSVHGILQARKENWSGLLFPSPGDLPNPGTEPGSPTLQADYLVFESPGKPSTSLL